MLHICALACRLSQSCQSVKPPGVTLLNRSVQASASRRVMIFEPLLTGHRALYVQTLITYLSELGREIVVVLPRHGRATKEFATVLEPLSHIAQYEFTIPSIEREGPQRLKQVRALVRSVRENSPALVLIPTADYLAQWCVCLWCLAWAPQFWSTQLHVNLIALPFGYPVESFRDVVKRLAYGVLLAIAPIRRTTTIDEINLQASWPVVPKVTRMRYAPEPIPVPKIPSKELERQRLHLPADRALIGVVGMIDDRKELGLLIAAAKRPEWPSNLVVVLAGPIATASRKRISESDLGERLVVRDLFLSEEEVMRYIKALDCLWLVYRGHRGPSATLLKALALGTQVVAQQEGWIGVVAQKYRHCCLARTRSPEEIARILSVSLGDHAVFPQTDLLVKHHPKKFAAEVVGCLAGFTRGGIARPLCLHTPSA